MNTRDTTRPDTDGPDPSRSPAPACAARPAGGAQGSADRPPSAADRARWDEIQRLFELCRQRPRDAWHRVLCEECGPREGLAFEVLSLLVASESLPPIDGARASLPVR